MRRSFMAILGLAPVAAISSPMEMPHKGSHQAGALFGAPLGPQQSCSTPDRVEEAKQRLNALKMARSADISLRDGALFHEKFEAEVNGMRSWSAVQRHRVIKERFKKTMDEHELLRAEQHLSRELKLMALPEWARRFL